MSFADFASVSAKRGSHSSWFNSIHGQTMIASIAACLSLWQPNLALSRPKSWHTNRPQSQLEGEGQEAKSQPQRKWRILYVSVLVANCTSATQETLSLALGNLEYSCFCRKNKYKGYYNHFDWHILGFIHDSAEAKKQEGVRDDTINFLSININITICMYYDSKFFGYINTIVKKPKVGKSYRSPSI